MEAISQHGTSVLFTSHPNDEWSIRDLLHWQNYPSLPITFPCFKSRGVYIFKCSRPEYSWKIARWTLNTNQSINQSIWLPPWYIQTLLIAFHLILLLFYILALEWSILIIRHIVRWYQRVFESEIILIPPSLKISENSSNGSYRNTDEVWWRYGISRSCDECNLLMTRSLWYQRTIWRIINILHSNAKI
jgi:hypothetical protein